MEQRCQEAFLGRTCDAWISFLLFFLQEKSCASLVVQSNGFNPLLQESAVVLNLRPAGKTVTKAFLSKKNMLFKINFFKEIQFGATRQANRPCMDTKQILMNVDLCMCTCAHV